MRSVRAYGFAKEAFLGQLGSVVARGIAGLSGRMAAAGGMAAKAAPSIGRAGAAIGAGAVKAEAGFASVGKSLMGGGNAATRASKTVLTGGAIPGAPKAIQGVGSRIMKRGLIGAGVGAGTSMLGDKLRGEDINVGKALTHGAVGGAVGAAAGTTVGKRFIRRVLQPHSSPSLSFSQAANPMNFGKAMGNGMSRPMTAWGNLSPLEKGFTAMSAYDAGKAIVHPDEHTGEHVGGAAGNIGAMMVGSRWKGMRRAWSPKGGGMFGSTVRSMGLLTAGDVAGRAVGRQADKMVHPKGPGEVSNAQ